MGTSRQAGTTHRGRARAINCLALLLFAGSSLAACAASATPSPTSTAEAEAIAPLPDTGDMEELDAGTYRVTGFTVPFDITVPDGWQSFGWGVLKEVGGDWQVFVNFLSPTSVPTEACKWKGTLVDIEPSPAAYADAMAAQTSTQTTPPVDIAMGDYTGLEFEYTVDSDVVFTECDEDRLCLFADGGASSCTRVYGDAQHRETERVLDLNGELAMIAVGQFREVDPALAAEAREVFDSITFDPPTG